MEHQFSILNTKETTDKINKLGIPIKLLVDFSALGHRVAYSCQEELLRTGFTDWRVWKHYCLDHILKMKQKLNKGTEVILCCDQRVNREYWRMKIYPDYKKMREKQVEQIPKELMSENFNAFQKELAEFFPFKVIKVPGAEGDDVIAVLSRDTNCANVIMSSDYDLYQLTDNRRNFMFSLKKDFFMDGGDQREHLLKKVCGGDSSDNVPNIFSDLDAITNPVKRQKSFTKIRFGELKEVFDMGGENSLINYLEETVRERYSQNKTLMDLSAIPDYITEAIKQEYLNCKIVGNANSAFKYCAANGMAEHLDRIGVGILN
jgi:hypothetical protein